MRRRTGEPGLRPATGRRPRPQRADHENTDASAASVVTVHVARVPRSRPARSSRTARGRPSPKAYVTRSVVFGISPDDDPSPLYGWAGWNPLEQAQALVGIYNARKADGWGADRLTPILAGVAELLPWIVQWHDEPDPETGERAGTSYEAFLQGELRKLGITGAALAAWRPAAKGRGKAAAPKAPPPTDDPQHRERERAGSPAKRGRKPKAAAT